MVKRLKVLMSAYACEPGKGSEPGVGWTVAREMARHHDIWVITRANNRPVIEAELARNPQPGLHFRLLGSAALGTLLEARQTWGTSLLLPLAAAHPRHRPRPRCRSEVRPHSSRDLRAVLGPKLPVLPGSTVRLGPGRRWRVGAAELLAGWRVVERVVRGLARACALDGRAGAFRPGDGAPKRGCAWHHRRDRGAAARARQQTGRDLFTNRIARR